MKMLRFSLAFIPWQSQQFCGRSFGTICFCKSLFFAQNGPINSAGGLLRCVREQCACAFCAQVATWSRVRYSNCVWATFVHLLACFSFNFLKVIFRKRIPFVSRHNLSICLNCEFFLFSFFFLLFFLQIHIAQDAMDIVRLRVHSPNKNLSFSFFTPWYHSNLISVNILQ